MQKKAQMEKLYEKLVNASDAPLFAYRKGNNYVPVIGEGSLDASIVMIGEAPGKKEAMTGKPFCGASGKMLDLLLGHINLKRENIYITNIVKDRPENNRDPKSFEIEWYAPYLRKQLEIIQPKVVVTLGRFSMNFIMKEYGNEEIMPRISEAHGNEYSITLLGNNIAFVPLYHPAFGLYNGSKREVLMKDFEVLRNFL